MCVCCVWDLIIWNKKCAVELINYEKVHLGDKLLCLELNNGVFEGCIYVCVFAFMCMKVCIACICVVHVCVTLCVMYMCMHVYMCACVYACMHVCVCRTVGSFREWSRGDQRVKWGGDRSCQCDWPLSLEITTWPECLRGSTPFMGQNVDHRWEVRWRLISALNLQEFPDDKSCLG